MKAISIRQPAAWSIIHAGKNIENRDWPTHFRGTVAIHAAQTMTRREYNSFRRFYKKTLNGSAAIKVPAFEELARGAIIGVVDIVDCVTEHDSIWLEGAFGFVLANPRPLPEPITCKGALSLWNVPPDVQQQINSSLSLKS